MPGARAGSEHVVSWTRPARGRVVGTVSAALAIVLAANAARATALDGMFNDWTEQTWYFGIGVAAAFMLNLHFLIRAAQQRKLLAAAHAVVAVLLALVYFGWAFITALVPGALPLAVGPAVVAVSVPLLILMIDLGRDR